MNETFSNTSSGDGNTDDFPSVRIDAYHGAVVDEGVQILLLKSIERSTMAG